MKGCSPPPPEAHFELGELYRVAVALPAAVKEFHAALDLNAQNSHSHRALGNTLLVQGDLASAESELRRATALTPGDSVAHFMLGQLLESTGKPGEAAQELHRSEQLSRNAKALELSKALNNEGNQLIEQGQFAEGAAKLEQAVNLNPTDPSAHFNYGVALVYLNQLDGAIAQFRAVHETKPTTRKRSSSWDEPVSLKDYCPTPFNSGKRRFG